MAKRKNDPRKNIETSMQACEVPLAEQNAFAIKRLEETVHGLLRRFPPASPARDFEGQNASNNINGGGAVQGLNTCIAPTKGNSGAIARLLEELTTGLSITHNLLDDLSKKLDPILAIQPQAVTQACPPTPGASCAAGDAIAQRILTVRSINSRIADFNDRITL